MAHRWCGAENGSLDGSGLGWGLGLCGLDGGVLRVGASTVQSSVERNGETWRASSEQGMKTSVSSLNTSRIQLGQRLPASSGSHGQHADMRMVGTETVLVDANVEKHVRRNTGQGSTLTLVSANESKVAHSSGSSFYNTHLWRRSVNNVARSLDGSEGGEYGPLGDSFMGTEEVATKRTTGEGN